MWQADDLVGLRSRNVDRYRRSFIRQAICELRFPTVLELGGDKPPPASFVEAIRKDYPTWEQANEVALNLGSSVLGGNRSHLFRSAKLTWTVSLKVSSVTLEGTSYPGYEKMRERILQIVAAASKVIDSDFFTRIGLRYVNVVDTGEDPASGWINGDLVAPLTQGVFKGVAEFGGKLTLGSEDGGCLLTHGLRVKPGSGTHDRPVFPEYLIDIDTFRSEVPISDVAKALDAQHSQAFNLFDWALGEKSREFLSIDKKSAGNK